MKLRPTKAAGSFDNHWEGSSELIVHMEADPGTLSFARFNFQSIMPEEKARAFHGMAAYLLRHEFGLFVLTVLPRGSTLTSHFTSIWHEADRILARNSTWLFATLQNDLLRDPHWSNAQMIAQCASAEIAPADQARVVDFLAGAGQAPLLECARRCEESIDSCDAALKLVANGVLHFNMSERLTLNSPVRLRPQHRASCMPWIQSPLRPSRNASIGSR
jgi:hypothetical protein